ncbi:hypothetical protein Sru01_25500 [Sphaerisporangium rufum]|uniref:Uncharacterized protein n=1 Tax=Sphaerisporangium rufum TaxID=1381558 RepID=A0A919R1E7_9ACTN|nr:hypothetical protein [Sphaerisporangium rufum]GII77568.1 hypothetical protein Sru01_25500 [Sphaerisporangium rufum]
MPDWTYHPLRGLAGALLGERHSQRLALRALAGLSSLPGGRRLIRGAFAHTAPPAELAGTVAGVAVPARIGALVSPATARDAVRALSVQGAGLIVVAPVGREDVELVRRAAAGRRCAVLARTDDPAVAAALAPHVDAVLADDAELAVLDDPAVAAALAALDDPRKAVLATPAVLLAAGPGWFQRVAEAATPVGPAPGRTGAGDGLRHRPAWWWGTWVGAGLAAAGLGAAAITLGPVLLWYDQDFLGLDVHRLHDANRHLVGFLRHDRLTMAGTMVALGVLYVGLAAGGIRSGARWARDAYLASGIVGFLTLFYFLRFGFVEPLHTAAAIVLFAMFVPAVRRTPDRLRRAVMAEGPESERRRSLTGQLLLIVTGAGLSIGGVVISFVALTRVFVPSDLVFLGTTHAGLHGTSPRLPAFVAHDRAGFGGALLATGIAVTLLSAWGWRRGHAWVWWSLAGAAAAGYLPPVLVHWGIGYTDFWHLAPVYLGMLLTAAALVLARPYLCARPAEPAGRTRHGTDHQAGGSASRFRVGVRPPAR